ncbi:MAG: hypothetical protein AB8B73_10710 [Ekhidna sp.]
MKKFFFFSFFLITLTSQAQFGVSYHQSVLSFFGANYTFKEKIFTELRFGSNIEIDDTYAELIATYIVKKESDYNVYIGIGATSIFDGGGVLPLGINIYPFEKKNFGFQTEVSYITFDEGIIRGSVGIRYRFLE